MYKDKPGIPEIPDETVIWRYMDFTKFVALLQSKSLYFVRTDRMEDVFEGSWPRANVQYNPKFLPEDIIEQVRENNEKIRKHILVSCWHANKTESDAMWRLYAEREKGIAIRSTVGSLKKCFIDKQDVFIGKINYIDYEKDHIPRAGAFSPCLYKQESFSFENEIRAYINTVDEAVEGNRLYLDKDVVVHGRNIPVDLNTLIEEIYIAPYAADWFTSLVSDILLRYGCKEIRPVQSIMKRKPYF